MHASVRPVGRIIALAALVAALLLPTAVAAGAPVTYPPGARPVWNLSLADWTARWYQWAYSFPAATNPVTDLTGARCGLRQAGRPVFFLGRHLRRPGRARLHRPGRRRHPHPGH